MPRRGIFLVPFQSAPGFLAGRNFNRGTIGTYPPCFNPLPAFWPGETCRPPPAPAAPRCFNPLPAFWPGETAAARPCMVAKPMFQSAPGFLAGRNRPHGGHLTLQAGVSIRSRLFGREKQPQLCGDDQPNPVSIRSRLFGREKLPVFRDLPNRAIVSIRSRLFGREKRPLASLGAFSSPSFNPLPAFWPGETASSNAAETKEEEFQSAPGFLAGRNAPAPTLDVHEHVVSIRSRLFGREKRGRWLHHALRPHRFNPLPAFWPGETRPGGQQPRLEPGFNPLPAFWPGETSEAPYERWWGIVSIRSRLFGREKPTPSTTTPINQ